MKAAIIAVFMIAFSTHHAAAVSNAVKMACKDDYFAHCSMHAVGSPGVRQCMRAVGPRLSQRCLGALAAAGEIKKEKLAAGKATGNKSHASTKPSAKKQVAKKSAASKTKLAKKGSGKTKLANKAGKGAKTKLAGKTRAKAKVAGKAGPKANKLAKAKGQAGKKAVALKGSIGPKHASKNPIKRYADTAN